MKPTTHRAVAADRHGPSRRSEATSRTTGIETLDQGQGEGRSVPGSEATSRTTGIETQSFPGTQGLKCHGSEATSRTTGIETVRSRWGSEPPPYVRKLHPGQQGLKQDPAREEGGIHVWRSEATSRTTGIETPPRRGLRASRYGDVRKLHPGQQGLKPGLCGRSVRRSRPMSSEATSRTTGIETRRTMGAYLCAPHAFGSYIQDNRD